MELIELMKRLTGELCGTANQIQIQFNSILWEWMELIELDWFVFGAAQGNSPVKSIMNEVNNWWNGRNAAMKEKRVNEWEWKESKDNFLSLFDWNVFNGSVWPALFSNQK